MFESIWDDIKQQYRQGNMVTRIIIVNTAFFLMVNLVRLVLVISAGLKHNEAFDRFMEWFALSGTWWENIVYPWLIFTSMFLHEGFFHFLFNMLFLYWFGRIVGDLIGDQRILPIYLLSGIAGGLVYILYATALGLTDGIAYGASGAVMGIVMASAAVAPDYIMRLILIGDVRLKYVVLTLILLDVIAIGNLANTGGSLAHLGGVAFGWFFIHQLRAGNDMSIPVNNFLHQLLNFVSFKNEKGPRVAYRNPNLKKKKKRAKMKAHAVSDDGSGEMSHQEQLDAILDKIKQSGYESLSSEEKEFLFNASKK